MKIAAIFSGSGSQYVGMGKELYDTNAIAKNTFDEADDVLGFKLSKISFDGSITKLNRMEIAQPAIYVLSTALFRVFHQTYGFRADFFAGHSMGEYSALTASNALTFSDGAKLLYARGKVLHDVGQQANVGMVAVSKLSLRQIEYVIRKIDKENLFVAVFNSEYQFVISGYRYHFKKLKALLEACGGHVEILNINTASHCPIMQDGMASLRELLDSVKFGKCRTPVISNVTALPYSDGDRLSEILSVHMIAAVRWSDSINYLRRQGVDTLVEIGPNVVLKNLVRHIDRKLLTYSLDETSDLHHVKQKCNAYSQAIQQCLRIAVAAQNHNDSQEKYQSQVVNKYDELRRIREKIDLAYAQPGDAELSIKLVEEILSAKKAPATEMSDVIDPLKALLVDLPLSSH